MGLSFNYRDAVVTASLQYAGVTTGLDVHAPTTLASLSGRLIILNGIERNRQLVDMTTTTLLPLMGSAPYGVLAPTVSYPGNGSIYGTNYKWRYRFVSSASGDTTGMSDPPDEGVNMGVVTISGGATALGSSASFYIPGRTGDDGTYYDRIQLIRNTSGQTDVWYVVDEKDNPGSGSYVLFIDNVTDDQLSVREIANLLPNPSHNEGPMWPVAKVFRHPTGRYWYYGIVRMPPFQSGQVTSGSNGDLGVTVSLTDAVVPGSGPYVPHERVGQKYQSLRSGFGVVIPENRTFHVVATGSESSAHFDVYPYLGSDPSAALSNGTYEITDDRDARAIFMTEPNLPTQVDTLKTVNIGSALDDPLFHVFGMGGVTYAITKRRIYRIDDDFSEDPSLSLRVSVVAEEGCAGLWACAETPIGLVYVNHTRGIRVFGGEMPMALGAETPVSQSPVYDQFQDFDKDLLSQVKVLYDPVKHRVFVSYPPTNGSSLCEALVYDLERGCWRGPWRTRLTSFMSLTDDGGGVRAVFGDGAGNLLTDDDAALDILNRDVSQAISGGIASIQNVFTFTPNGMTGTLDPSSDKRVVGCPIVFVTPAGVRYLNWVAGWDGTYITLLNIPSVALVTTWSWYLAAIDWQATSGYLDAGEPIQPKTLENVRMRLEPGASGASEGAIAAAPDGSGTYAADGASTATISSYDGTSATPLTYAVGSLQQGGQDFQIRLSGLSQTRNPRITKAIADIRIGAGSPRTP